MTPSRHTSIGGGAAAQVQAQADLRAELEALKVGMEDGWVCYWSQPKAWTLRTAKEPPLIEPYASSALVCCVPYGARFIGAEGGLHADVWTRLVDAS